MTKINLLPDYIWEGKRRTRTIFAVLAGLLAELLLLGFWMVQTQNQLTAKEQERDAAQQQADVVDKITQKASTIESSIKPITDKTAYVEDVLRYNKRFPELFERTNIYTSNRVGYRQLQPAMTVLNMTAYARNVSDIGRYLLNLQRAKDTFTAVAITSQMPGWPSTNTDTSGTGGYMPAMAASAPGASFGPNGSGGFGPTGLTTTPTTVASGPMLLDFTAVGQLAQKFQFNPPIYGPAGGASASATGGYGGPAYGGGPPGSGGFGPAGPVPGGGGANGGGANGGGANGGG